MNTHVKSLFILCLMGFGALASAGTKVIEKPSYEVRTSGITNIDRIELTGQTMRLYIRTEFIPNWWVQFPKETFVRAGGTEQKIYATGIENGAFDKKINMPASGDSTFVLIFPRFDKSVKTFDYGEIDDVELWGVSLEKPKKKKPASYAAQEQWIGEQLAQAKRTTLVDYDSPEFFTQDTARVIGYIKGYDPRLGFATGLTYASNVITNEDFPLVAEIRADGCFEVNIPVTYPVAGSLIFKNKVFPYYVEPGATLAMILDWEEFLIADRRRDIRYKFENTAYRGLTAQICREVNAAEVPVYDYKLLMEGVKNLTPVAFQEKHRAYERQTRQELEAKLSACTEQAKRICRNELTLQVASDLFNFVMYRSFEGSEAEKTPVEDSYYDFLKTMPLDDPTLLISHVCGMFLNRFEYAEFFKSGRRKVFYDPREMSPRERKLEEWIENDRKMDTLGLPSSFVFEVAKVRSLLYALSQMSEEEAGRYLFDLKKGISQPFLRQEADRILQIVHPEEPVTAYEIPEGKGGTIFHQIIDPLKGKKLVVDFWGIFCGPCIASIKSGKEMREKYTAEGLIDFIYVTSESESPKDRYDKFVEEHGLKHTVRLSDDDYAYMRQLFAFNGIPRYVLLDEEGRVLDDNFMMYNFEYEFSKYTSGE
jgi:thiol-disulfide isomerase/thioredoxin